MTAARLAGILQSKEERKQGSEEPSMPVMAQLAEEPSAWTVWTASRWSGT